MAPLGQVAVWVVLLAAIVVGGAIVRAEILQRRRAGRPLVEFTPRRPVPWSAAELAVAVGVYLALLNGAVWLAAPRDEAGDLVHALTPQTLLSTAAASALATLVVAALVALVSRATPADLGLATATLRRDVALGAAAFAAILLPIYLVQALLSLVFDGRHPILDMLEGHRDGAFFLAAGVAAVGVAPLAEEFFFRALLQGWLEKVWPVRPPAPADVGAPPTSSPPDAPLLAPSNADGAELQTAGYPTGWGPILASSGVFALMHLGHGPAPIPLFLLALVLGYLYARTHRIWPGLVLHMLLNGCSLALVWTGVGG